MHVFTGVSCYIRKVKIVYLVLLSLSEKIVLDFKSTMCTYKRMKAFSYWPGLCCKNPVILLCLQHWQARSWKYWHALTGIVLYTALDY